MGAYRREHLVLFSYIDEAGHRQYRKKWMGWMRKQGINPKRKGTNPRAKGTNARATGENPRALR